MNSTLPTETESFARAMRAEFPILSGSELIYLDSAASQQKPRVVIDALHSFYSSHYANVHRALYRLAAEATERFEAARRTTSAFLNAATEREVVFTRGTTESINIVAASWGRTHLKAGDEVLVSVAEHHSNLVPWQMLCQSTGAALRFVELSADESVDEASVVDLIGPKTRIVALSMLSNVLGSSLEFSNISQAARGVGAIVCVDAAQAVAHQRIDVQAMGVDFVAFSGHKLFGPTGVGVLWGREKLLLEMPPVWGGGQMIERVGRDSSTYAMPPHRFEAGTPPIGEVIGLGAAIEWLSNVGISNIDAHESVVLAAFRKVLDDEGVRVVGPKDRQSALLSFAMPGVHPHDLAQLFDSKGMCVRAGHHCAQPLMAALNEFALTRLSISPYTSLSDVDRFRDALREARRFFG